MIGIKKNAGSSFKKVLYIGKNCDKNNKGKIFRNS